MRDGNARCEIWSDLACASGVRLDFIPDVQSARATLAIESEESLTLTLPDNSRIRPLLTSGRVVRVVPLDDQATFTEWRIVSATDAKGLGPAVCTVQAQAVLIDLADAAFCVTFQSGGTPSFTIGAAGITPTQAVDTFVVAALAAEGLTWFTRGTIDPTVTIDLAGTWNSPLEVLRAIVSAVRKAGVFCELRIRRNGAVDYKIDLLTQIGAGAVMPRLSLTRNLTALGHGPSRLEQVTRAIPKGTADVAGLEATIGRARWKVTNVNGGTKKLTLADLNAGAGPLAFVDQLKNSRPGQWFLERVKSGRTFQVQGCDEQLQTVTLLDVSDIAAGEMVAFRLSEPLSRVGYWCQDPTYGIDGAAGGLNGLVEITAVGGANPKHLTVKGNYSNAVGDVVAVDGQHVDRVLVRYAYLGSLAFTIDGINWPERYLTTTVTFGAGPVAIGDVIVAGSNNAAPYAKLNYVGVVTAVDAVNHRIAVRRKYSSGTCIITNAAGWIRVYRPQAGTFIVASSVAAADTMDVDANGVTTSDLVEITVPWGNGPLPYFLESPADRVAYGGAAGAPKIQVVSAELPRGEAQLIPNPWMRDWTGIATTPPDGWTVVVNSTGVATQRTTSPLFTMYGGASWLLPLRRAAGGAAQVETPAAFATPSLEAHQISARVRLLFPVFSGDLGVKVELSYRNGTALNILAKVEVAPTNHSAPPAGSTLVAAGQWLDLVINGVEIASLVTDGFVLRLNETSGNPIDLDCYLDAAMLWLAPVAPPVTEYGDAARLWQSANLVLRDVSTPPIEISQSFVDLERLNPTTWANDAVTLGGYVRVLDADAAFDTTARVMQLDRDYLEPQNTTVTLSTKAKRLSQLL
ncbi:MAG: hypothetical protein JWO05_1144 [Gemmatimonadetes bacterium]|nr:hypothetical protein [Gemmatimonadota bacterium]